MKKTNKIVSVSAMLDQATLIGARAYRIRVRRMLLDEIKKFNSSMDLRLPALNKVLFNLPPLKDIWKEVPKFSTGKKVR